MFEIKLYHLLVQAILTLVAPQNGKRNFQNGKRKSASKRTKRKRQNGIDFIKDSAVKTINGIQTEFAKTATAKRRNGTAKRQNGNGQNGKTASENRNGKMQNGEAKMDKTAPPNGKTVKTVNGKTANGQNGKRSKRSVLKRKRKTVKRQNGQNGKTVQSGKKPNGKR